MKKLAKRIICSVLAASVLLLAACNSGGTGNDKKEGEKVKISFWHTIPVGSTNYESFEELVLGFNSSQDKYEVEHAGYPFFDYFDKMTTAFSGGVAPDVFIYTMDNIPSRAADEVTMNLTPYIERDNYSLNDLYELEVSAGVYDEKQYALPFSSTCRLLYYNIDMMEAAGLTEADVPTTWDELYEVAHKMDIVENGTIKQLGFDPFSQQSNYFMYLWQKGLDYFDAEGNPAVNTPENLEVLQWMADFNAEHPKTQLQAFTDASKTLAADAFISGKMGMMIGVDEEYKLLQTNEVPFKYGVASIPLPENGKRVTWSSCFSIEAINSKDEDKMNGSWEFIKYMLKPESQSAFYESQGWLSASKEAVNKLKGDPIMDAIIEELDYAQEKVYIDYSPNWNSDWDQFKERIIAGEDAASILKDMQKFYEEKQTNYEATR